MPNLPLPIELRVIILRLLLVVDQDSSPRYISLDRLVSNRHHVICLQNFRIVSQVCHAMREEAQAIFFEENGWNLRLKTWRSQRTYYKPGRYLPSEVNSVAEIRARWGEQAVARIRYASFRITGTVASTVQDLNIALGDFMPIFRCAQNLRRLRIIWENFIGPYMYGHLRSEDKRWRWRRRDGTRLAQLSDTDWLEEEQILRPFKDLRGLQEAYVTGAVSDKWATWLEKCMTSKVGEHVPAMIGDEKRSQP
ncbi:hypothetical protein BGZ60DRAFT_405463 [Tricladium varicosporioides]|nr:hypothetical protein BGZ60DRAFT_405463 [Hymenoscyphus varicosporioides]